MNRVIHNYTAKYIREKVPERTSLIKQMEQYAELNHIPIIEPEVAQMLKVIILLKKPTRILEIGTAIAYSTILMAQASFYKDIIIDTVERNYNMVEIAKQNIKQSGLENNINVHHGDANEIIADLDEKYDLIFIDAAKSHYKQFVEMCINKLKSEGLIICDDVLFRGMIANDKLIKKRKITIVKKMRQFIDYITQHQQLETTIIPLGDGVSISYLKGE